MNFSVMTMNLRINNPKDNENTWPYRLHRVVEIFETHCPLIVGTQEGFYLMIKDLQKRLPDYRWIGNSRGPNLQDEHCAIFYKATEVEPIHHGQFWLSETPEQAASMSWDSAFPRICTWGIFRFRSEPHRQIVIYNTHLDHIGQLAREKGVQLILDKMNDHIQQGWPVILMGDLNAKPANQAIRFFDQTSMKNTYSLLNYTPGATFHNFSGKQEGQPIDYIFVSPNVKVDDTEVIHDLIDGGYPSDHFPVSAQLTV